MNLTERQNLVCEISDTYKSLNGIRPRWNWDQFSIEDLKTELAALVDQVRQEMAEEKAAKEAEAAALKPAPAWTIGDFCDAVIALNR